LAIQREMGNRGSKSNYIKFVKEQRANGSYINKKIKDLVLRCALRGFERKFIAGNPSNIILNKQLYTTTTAVSSENLPQLANGSSLNPWFITGFTFFYIYKKSTQRVDGDGSFTVSISKKNTGMGWKIQPIFTIGLDPKDLDPPLLGVDPPLRPDLLVQIQAFFKIGKIHPFRGDLLYCWIYKGFSKVYFTSFW
jgi:hypothetical protein